jgi:hypothetical protein
MDQRLLYARSVYYERSAEIAYKKQGYIERGKPREAYGELDGSSRHKKSANCDNRTFCFKPP